MKIWSVFAVVLLVACAETERSPTVAGGSHDAGLCTDGDGDGFGDGCESGGDCNDNDPAIHKGCLSCVRPAEGCACENSTPPVSCYLDPSTDSDGTVMCREGTRYCRSGSWSGCESIFTYPKPITTPSQAVVNMDAGLEKCSDCKPNCFVVRDNLNPVDGGLGGTGNNAIISDGGGLTISTYQTDAAPMDSGTWDAAACMVGSAPDKDCDGILDQYDPYPTTKPFATANPTIFLDVGKGATATGVVNLAFYLNSADVYFLLDQTGSMSEERANLVSALNTGDYVQNNSYNCSDYDFDFKPNNELKAKGIVGAIRCYIRDANFGVGFFRELPFDLGYTYGDNDEIAFRNLQDITSNVDLVTAGVNKLATDGNIDWTEAAMPGLYTLVTGNGMYFGVNKPSIPSRGGCASGFWGYPCFRPDAIPIVVLFTDAPTHNGPSDNTLPYTNNLTYTGNTGSTITEIGSSNERVDIPIDVGDVTNKYVSFSGDTTNMMANSTTSAFTCAPSSTGADAFFKFSLSAQKTMTLSTEGSDFDTVLAVWSGTYNTFSTLPSYPNTNDNTTAPYAFNDVLNKWVQASGNDSGFASDYLATDMGCGAYPGSPDATFSFTLSAATRVALDTLGSSIGTNLTLFSGTTPTPPPSTTSISSTNDKLWGTAGGPGPYDVGTIDNAYKAYSATTSSGSNIVSDYSAAVLGCSPDDTTPDATWQFTVGGSTNRRVRISSEGSTIGTVLSLVSSSSGTSLPTVGGPYTNNETTTSNPVLLGSLDGKAFQLSGNTANMNTDYTDTTVMGCNASSRDAVYQFTLGSTKTVTIDTNSTSTAFDTVLNLFKGASTTLVSSDTHVNASSSYDNASNAGSLGTVNLKRYIVDGNSPTTNGLTADYSAAQVTPASGSCGAVTASPDAVYKLHFDAPTRVRIDTTGSGFDTVVSLHNWPPSVPITTGGDTTSNATAAGNVGSTYKLYTNMDSGAGTTNMAANYVVNNGTCVANDGSPDAVVAFNVNTTGTYQIDTIGSGFDTVLGIFAQSNISTLPSGANVIDKGVQGDKLSGNTTINGTTSSPIDLGNISNSWKTYTGTYADAGDDSNLMTANPCAADKDANDVFYSFSIDAGQTLRVDTTGSGYDGVLGVFKSDNTMQGCNNTSGAATGDVVTLTNMAAGNYYIALKGRSNNRGGAYRLTIRASTAAAATSPLVYCDDNSGSNNTSKITASLTAGSTYYAVIKGKTYTDSGTYQLSIKHVEYANTLTALACNDNASSSTTTSSLEYDITAAGDYYVVVKGKSNTSGGYGSYVLTVQDISTTPDGSVTCNDNASASTLTSAITQTLPAGTYWVVLKGRANATARNGEYVLNIRDTAVNPITYLTCSSGGGAGGTSFIERDFAPGTYKLVVKGKASTDIGNYRLQFRDVTNGAGRIACDYNSGGSGKSYLEAQLAAGTYTVVLKGDSATAAGDYKLSVRDATNVVTSSASQQCNDNLSTSNRLSKISSVTLNAGTYTLGVKGASTSDRGRYQVHFGSGTTSSGSYTPPTWTQTLAALTAKKVKVIPILSCKDDPDHGNTQGDCNTARTQYTALANATNTLGSNLQPLIYDIQSNGTGLSDTVVKGITSLAQYLEMNVAAQVAFSPDKNPTPGFLLTVKAVDKAGDGCDGIIGTEHQKCMPGATPRFEISFTNPENAPVPRNPSDPKGGYNFKAQLIANGQFIVDEIPIYIIPENVTNVPPPPTYYAMGTYYQNLSGIACTDKTDLPDWGDLTWSASIPNGTSVTFSACGAATTAALSTCTYIPLCKITGGGACSPTTPCPSGSFCSPNNNCWAITGNSCTDNSKCGTGATCINGTCVYASQPVDVGQLLGSQNFTPNLRVQIGMTANTTANTGPTVNDWSINYFCKSAL